MYPSFMHMHAVMCVCASVCVRHKSAIRSYSCSNEGSARGKAEPEAVRTVIRYWWLLSERLEGVGWVEG